MTEVQNRVEKINPDVDRSKWRIGPWDNEPDEVNFEVYGLRCSILRQKRNGTLCGYVGVPNEHPASNLCGNDPIGVPCDVTPNEFASIDKMNAFFGEAPSVSAFLSPHGGVTYTGAITTHWLEGLWCFGFDCNHAFDACPQVYPGSDEDYRDIGYVEDEVIRMAERLSQSVFIDRARRFQR